MDRMTISAGIDGNYVPGNMCFFGMEGLVDECDSCMEYCEKMEGECDGCAIQECFNRLATYEDTGLTPGKIQKMDKMYQELSREVMAYRKIGTAEECRAAAGKDGPKEVILNYKSPDDYPSKPSAMLCPGCHTRLIGNYLYRKRCPECGQALYWRDVK